MESMLTEPKKSIPGLRASFYNDDIFLATDFDTEMIEHFSKKYGLNLNTSNSCTFRKKLRKLPLKKT